MTRLLEFIAQYLQVLYLNPAYRFTNSRSRGLADIDASITLSSERLTWVVSNDRGQFEISVAPTRVGGEDDWFWLSVIRQYLGGGDDTEQGSTLDQVSWLATSLPAIEGLFADDRRAAEVCAELNDLQRANAYKNWGIPHPEA